MAYKYLACEFFPTLRSHTTGEFHGSHNGSILPSQFQKTIVRKLSIQIAYKKTISKKLHDNILKKIIEKIITSSIFHTFN